MTKVIPVFVAIMVWLIRVLIIGTFSMAGERLFSQDKRPARRPYSSTATRSPATFRPAAASARPRPQTFEEGPSPDPEEEPASKPPVSGRYEPTYHPIGLAARGNDSPGSKRS
jgi:hypothetical protein